MTKRATTITLLILIAGAALFAQQGSAVTESRPRLSIPSFEHSFGTVKAGTPLKYTFKIKNEGDGKLEITNVSPSCGCTTSSYDKAIEAGQTGGITLAIEKTENYRGEIIKSAEVTSNDPDHSKFTLTLKADFSEK